MASAELKLQIVLPLAGKSHRFKAQGILTPKPILPVLGKPMVQYALESIESLLPTSQVSAIVCLEDNIQSPIAEILNRFTKNSAVIELSERTAGPVQTVLSLESALDPEAGLLLVDGDISFRAEAFCRILSHQISGADGYLLSFTSNDPAFSYVREDSSGRVLQIAEKKVISNQAMAGAYHFRRTGDFLQSASKLVTQRPTLEHYTSYVIADLIENGAEFRRISCDSYHCLGTPEHLLQSERFLI